MPDPKWSPEALQTVIDEASAVPGQILDNLAAAVLKARDQRDQAIADRNNWCEKASEATARYNLLHQKYLAETKKPK